MTIESDIEMIRSALLYGDADDAYRMITEAYERTRISLRYRATERLSSYNSFLQRLRDVLEGRLSIDGFRAYLEHGGVMGKLYRMPDEDRRIMEGFLYQVELSLDRYNIRYPRFDMKRCGDL
ncbi:MAG TPA: hypothetical protein VKU79_04270 [Thermoplasmataceae archaeon]|nr:hypothetical protein [Thermoplasmatales archaeon AK]HLH86060.1 hypothetical protein [Thermoplasmataceae archaeon]